MKVEESTPERISVIAKVDDYSKTTMLHPDEAHGKSVFVPPLPQLKTIILSETLGNVTSAFAHVTEVTVTPTTSSVTLETSEPFPTKRDNLTEAQIRRLFFEACWCASNSISRELSLVDYDSFELSHKNGNPKVAHYVSGEHIFTLNTQNDLPIDGNHGNARELAITYQARRAGAISEDTMRATKYEGEFEVIRTSKDWESDSVSIYDIGSMIGRVPELEKGSPYEPDIGAAELWFLGLHLFNLVTGIDAMQNIQLGSSPLLESFKIMRLVDPAKFEREIERVSSNRKYDEFWRVVVSAHQDELSESEIELGLREKSDRFVYQYLPLGDGPKKRLARLLKTFGKTILKLTHPSPVNRLEKLSQNALPVVDKIISGHLFKSYRINTPNASPETLAALTALEEYYSSNSREGHKWYWGNSGELASNLEKISLSQEFERPPPSLPELPTEKHMEACEYCGHDYHKSYLGNYGGENCQFRHKKYCSRRCYDDHVYNHNF